MTTNNDKSPGPSTRLILASGSPRRRQLLGAYGYAFEVIRPPFDEPDQLGKDIAPASHAEALSFFKARSVAETMDRGVIIGGDTVVALAGECFGKPLDRDDARAILGALSGTTQEVVTGVTLFNAATGERVIRSEVTAVTMRPLSSEEIETYLDTGAWEGKAGAYGIQDRGDAFIERIEGSFTNVVGMPMELLSGMLSAWGIEPTSGRNATVDPGPVTPSGRPKP